MKKILKVHGGATIPRTLGEGPFKQRLSENVDAKMAIAKIAASLVQPGETLFIDTGSTTLLFAEELANVPDLTIITNSTEIARTIASFQRSSRVFLLGGEFSLDNSQTVGTMAANQVKAFRAHHAVVTVGAMNERCGAMDYDIDEAQIAQAMIEQAEDVTVLADSSKFGKLASFEVCALHEVNCLVTDLAPPPGIREAIETVGGRVILPV